MLIVTAAIKVLSYIKIYESFQRTLLLMKHCILKMIPYSILLYIWILVASMIFRILGADTGNAVNKDEDSFFGPFFHFFLAAYKSSMGEGVSMRYEFWSSNHEQDVAASHFMAGFIWLLYFVNQFAIAILGLNFFVALISQSYEEELSKSILARYTYKCDMVREASIITNLIGLGRKLQTFTLSCQSSYKSSHQWSGVVNSVQQFVRNENISIKTKVNNRMEELRVQLDKRTDSIEGQVTDVMGRLN
jgi:hypothetical protein